MNPTDLMEATKEALITRLEALNDTNDSILDEMVAIRSELLARLEEENKDGEVIGDYSIKKTKRTNYRTTLQQAEELGAVKKAVDADILKKLTDKGVAVPGMSTTTFLTVKRII
jgi:hypothetical protein